MNKTQEQLKQESRSLGMALANCREALKLVNEKVYLPERVKPLVEWNIQEANRVLEVTGAITPPEWEH